MKETFYNFFISKTLLVKNMINKLFDFINNHKFLKYGCLLLLLIGVYFYYLYGYGFKEIHLHHDSIQPLLMAEDILKGNFLLKDWYGSTRPWIFEVYLFLLIPFSLFRFSIYMEAYYPAFVMLLLISSMYFVSVKNKNKSTLFLFITLIVIYPIPYNMLTRLGYSQETFVAVFFCLYLVYYIIKNNIIKLRYYMLLLILSFAASTYNLQHYAFIFPMFFVLVYRYIFITRNKIEIYLALTVVGGLILNKVGYFIVSQFDGVYYGGGYEIPKIVSYNDFISNIFDQYIVRLMNLTNSNPFGKPTIESIPYFAGILLLCFGFYLVFKILRNFNKHDVIDQFVSTHIVIWTILLVLTPFAKWMAGLYYYILILMMIVLIVRNNIFEILYRRFSDNKLYYRSGVLITICILCLIGYKNIVPLSNLDIKKFYNSNELANIIKDNKLGYGYTLHCPYGLTPTIFLDTNYLKDNQTSGVLALLGGELNRPHFWTDKSTWYEKPAHFLVADNHAAPIDKYTAVYGKPDKIISTKDNKAHVLIYKKDLSEYLITNSFKTVMKCNNNSVLKDNILKINPKSQCDGPFVRMYKSKYMIQNPGKYRFIITGSNLDKLEFKAGDRDLKNNKFKELEMLNIKHNDTEITFELDIKKRLYNLEFILTNNSNEQIDLFDFKKKRID